ncbi:SVEP1 [Branchiostoma lanceolatum]|uniref:SVEP1 protein n=1 Tax=Branchiostoma lanceolatum TaxID=7740 RepID=A0A8K0A6T7_BRALA|nr:SVEP1 [Branchiostoma lanceolatum]
MGTFVVMSLLVIVAVFPSVGGQSAKPPSVVANTLTASLPTPNRAIDIIFALDRSGSVGSSNYNKIIDFMKAVLSHFSVAPSTTRVAVVSFGTDAKVEFDLLRSTSNDNNKCELLRTYIPTIKYTGGGTNTRGALKHALALLKKPGVRSFSTKVIFTITDGYWNVGGDPAQVVSELQNRGVYMYAFGIGGWGVNNYRLSGLGNNESDGHEYVYLCLDFNILSEVARRFKGECSKDTYKDTLGPGKCKNCPTHSETSGTGATSKTDCQCKAGYYRVGDPIERCEPVTCHEPVYDNNAVEAVSCGTWTFNDRCSLECKSGYEYSSGERVLTCESSGSWNAVPLSCERVTCPTLTAPQDGSISTCGNRYGDTCTFQCDYSFKLSGSATTTCTAAKTWSHPTPICNKLLCRNSEIADPFPNANRVCSGSHTEVGNVCSVTCNTGYKPRLEQTSRCSVVNGAGEWQNLPRACEVDKCDPLTDPSDGTVSPVVCKMSPEYNRQCTYSCDKQYTLHGPTSKTCETGGVWSSTAASSCRDEMDPTFLNCPDDISAVAQPMRTEANVLWIVPTATDNSGSTPTVDVVITTSLGPVNFLQRTPPIWFEEGQYTVTYTATDREGNRATCDFSILVEVTRCILLSTPANGKTTPNPCGVFRGFRCDFSCDSGYNLVGDVESTCQDDGSWSSPAPTCQVVHCSSLSAPPNTAMSGCYGTRSQPYGKVCSFDCITGYKIKRGTRSRQCLADGSWSGNDLECEVVTCPNLNKPAHGTKSGCNNAQEDYNTVCTFYCNKGYSPKTSIKRTCQQNGTWSGSALTCAGQ